MEVKFCLMRLSTASPCVLDSRAASCALSPVDDARRLRSIGGSLTGMALADWCDLDLAHLLIFGTHSDLTDASDEPAI